MSNQRAGDDQSPASRAARRGRTRRPREESNGSARELRRSHGDEFPEDENFDLEPYDIGVSLVCPGAVDTPLVGTVEIVDVDRSHPAVGKLTERFRRRAVSAERVGEIVLDAVERGRYLVFTSHDTRILFALQSFCPPAYRFVMRQLNRQLTAVGERACSGRD